MPSGVYSFPELYILLHNNEICLHVCTAVILPSAITIIMELSFWGAQFCGLTIPNYDSESVALTVLPVAKWWRLCTRLTGKHLSVLHKRSYMAISFCEYSLWIWELVICACLAKIVGELYTSNVASKQRSTSATTYTYNYALFKFHSTPFSQLKTHSWKMLLENLPLYGIF